MDVGLFGFASRGVGNALLPPETRFYSLGIPNPRHDCPMACFPYSISVTEYQFPLYLVDSYTRLLSLHFLRVYQFKGLERSEENALRCDCSRKDELGPTLHVLLETRSFGG